SNLGGGRGPKIAPETDRPRLAYQTVAQIGIRYGRPRPQATPPSRLRRRAEKPGQRGIQGFVETRHRRHVPQLQIGAESMARQGSIDRRQRPYALLRRPHSPAHGAGRRGLILATRAPPVLHDRPMTTGPLPSAAAPIRTGAVIRRLFRDYVAGQ